MNAGNIHALEIIDLYEEFFFSYSPHRNRKAFGDLKAQT